MSIPALFSNESVVVLAPHNDDEVIGCWFLMRRLAGQADIRVIVVTRHDTNPELTERRREETRAALAKIGVTEIDYWDIPDGDARGFRPRIEERLREEARGDHYVLCPAPNDRTPDHVPIAEAAFDIIPKERLIWYRSTWWTFTSRHADFEATGAFADKKAALACFKSQGKIALLRSVVFSQIESLLTTGTLRATEQFMFASKARLAPAPLNSISLRHFSRLIFWR